MLPQKLSVNVNGDLFAGQLAIGGLNLQALPVILLGLLLSLPSPRHEVHAIV
jgi:hypothetical protein